MAADIYGDGTDDMGTLIMLGDSAVMRWPAADLRSAYTVGQHRLVPANAIGSDIFTWMCFDHGWDCWVTEAARQGPQP